MKYLDKSLIIKNLNLIQFSKNSKFLNFLNKLDNKFCELFMEIDIKLKFWWKRSFIFNQLIKKEQKIKAFENSHFLDICSIHLINASKGSYFLDKFLISSLVNI